MGDGSVKTLQVGLPTFIGYITDAYETMLPAVQFSAAPLIETGIPTSPNAIWATVDDVTVGQLPSPVPEPATFAALGLGALALIRRRKA
jgi:hypothetical protein